MPTNWLRNPYRLRDENENGYITSAMLGTHMWTHLLQNLCHLGDLPSGE